MWTLTPEASICKSLGPPDMLRAVQQHSAVRMLFYIIKEEEEERTWINFFML